MSNINKVGSPERVYKTDKILIKNTDLCNDPWRDSEKNTEKPIYKSVSLCQWRQERGELLTEEWALGITLPADSDLYEIDLLDDLDKIDLISIEFSTFTDGRGFSLAAQLRQYGFTGELRATGAIILDQLYYLYRCGFNAFELSANEDVDIILNALKAFSKGYQPGW